MASDQQNRYTTLRDYLGMLRRQKFLIAAFVLIFAAAAYALSSSQDEKYESQASVQFNDIARDLKLLGVELPSDTNPLVKSAAIAEETTTLQVADQVRRELNRGKQAVDIPAEDLRDAIETKVGAQTVFLEILAEWGDAEFAARLANAYAKVVVRNETKDIEKVIETAIKDLRPQAKGPVFNEAGGFDAARFTARQQLTALENARGLLNPAEIVRRAEVPSQPSAPKTQRNLILGGLVGLALGLLAGFLRDSLDRRLRTPQDAHEGFGLPILGRVGTTAFGGTGQAGANGRAPLAPPDLESFRILRTNLAALESDEPVKTVLVTSGLPEEGKSTVAASLAAAAAAAGQRTLLVEADMRRPVLARRLGVQGSPGLAEYLMGTAKPADVLQRVPVHAASGTNGSSANGSSADRALVFIASGNAQGEPTELLASPRCRDFLESVAEAYDLVVIDSSPLLSTADPLELLPHADSVLVCARLSSSTRDVASAVREAIGRFPQRPAGLVVTGARKSDAYYGYYGY
jgi:capsular exopolysaccharide synthesis family protein